MTYQHGVTAIVLIVAALLAAAGLGVVSFWTAIIVTLGFCVFAAVEAVCWYRAYRRAEHVRAFIARELDRMPPRPAPTRRQVLRHVSEYPASRKPFIRRSERANAQ